MKNEIAKSPEMLRREAEVKDLQAQLKKKQTTLKSLKTRLKNMQADVTQIGRNVHTQMFHKMEILDKLRLEIAELARQLNKAKGLSKEDKKQLKMMADDLAQADAFGPGFEQFKSQKQKMESGNFNFDEDERAKMVDMFESFKIAPPEKEQREIRKVYLKLSQRFHPDLAKGDKEAADFHDLMQQINEAYQHNDIHALLELETLFASDNLDFETKTITVDVLEAETKRLKRDLDFIEKQIDRTSDEIKNLRNSDLGQMLTVVNKADREGEGFKVMGENFDESIELFTKLKEGLEDSIKLGRISPILMEMTMQDDDFDDDFAANPLDMLMRMAQGDTSAFDFFEGFDDEDLDEVEDPKFPIGSSVKVTKSLKMPGFESLEMKGWTGRVVDAFYGDDDEVMYEVSFDSITMSEMPTVFIKNCVEADEDFQDFDVMEKYLQACPPRDSEDDSLATYRRLYHAWNWQHLKDPSQIERLKRILLADPVYTDQVNWELHLTNSLTFPFEAKVNGKFGLSKKQGVVVVGPAGFSQEVGHIATIRLDGTRKIIEYPLQDLRAKDKKIAAYTVLLDYAVWAGNQFEF